MDTRLEVVKPILSRGVPCAELVFTILDRKRNFSMDFSDRYFCQAMGPVRGGPGSLCSCGDVTSRSPPFSLPSPVLLQFKSGGLAGGLTVSEHPVGFAGGPARPLVRRTSVCQGARAPLRPLALPALGRGLSPCAERSCRQDFSLWFSSGVGFMHQLLFCLL